MKKLTRFIYEGLYYPVIGNSNGWIDGTTKQVLERRFGGWTNWEKWWSFSYGIKCKLDNPSKPYKNFVLNEIEKHPEMEIKKLYFDEDNKEIGYIWSVVTNYGSYIGDFGDAYSITPLINLQSTSGEKETTVAMGWDPKEQIAYGWSHRAKVGFRKGDKVFEENFGDDSTPYRMHGRKTIKTYADAMKAARAFARSVS